MERIIITLDRQGNFRGASAQDWDGMPAPVDADWLNSFAPTINTAALARIAELEAEIAALQAAPQEPPPTSLVAETITALHAAFSSTLPTNAQASFAVPYAIVRVLIEAEQWQLAAAVIQSVAVPPELEAAKAGLIAIIPTV